MPKVLLITYYFPPSGGPGVQRTLKFARYLPAFGWRPTVLTVRPEDAAYPDLDPTLAGELPSDVRAERTRAWDPYALYARLLGKEKSETVSVGFLGEAEVGWKERLARWIRANVFLPDARVGWTPFAIRRGLRLLREDAYDAIFTTGPPHSTHLIGWALARRTGVPWVADFRDLWTEIDYAHKLPTTALARRIDAALERSVLKAASTVTVVTPTWKRNLARHAEGRCEVIRNGFDPADFEAGAPALDPAFTVAHLGNLNDARNPQALWQALKALKALAWQPPPRVRLIGNVDPVVMRAARARGVEALVEAEPYVPHAEAVRVMRRSALLLLMIDRVPHQEGRIPGKLYEYIASGRPVLGLGPPEGDAAQVLEEAGAGRMFAHDDAGGVVDFLQEHYAAWTAGTPRQGAAPEAAAPYSRRRQTQALADLLNKCSRT